MLSRAWVVVVLTQLCNGLFPHYILPDGRMTHFYYKDFLNEVVREQLPTSL